VGVATDDIRLWISVGAAIGAGVGSSLMQKGCKKENEEPPNKNG
tara:strand:+ start:411 stop:542 length:132 start_codon:yes stop_codon:yes gene_type:complete